MRQHPRYPEIYVTEEGEVFMKLTPSEDSGGYHQIRINRPGGYLRERRHTLVAEAFHGKQQPGQQVRHLDGDPSNDHASNLEWGDLAENIQDAVRHGTHRTGAKTTAEQREEIRQRAFDGESPSALAREFGISPQRVCDYKAGR